MWTAAKVEDFRDELVRQGQKTSTINLRLRTLSYAAQRWAKRAGTQNFALGVELLREDKPERAPLSDEEMDRLTASCIGDRIVDLRNYALVVMFVRTGVRRGGLHKLNCDDIGSDRRIQVILKGGRPHSFILDDQTHEALQAWFACLHQHGITSGAVFRRVRKNRIGDRMSPFQIWHVVSEAAKHAKIRHVFPHLLRHTLVTVLREDGATPLEVSGLTGQSEETIMRTYTHHRPTHAVALANRLRRLPE
jgi:site-specific recombinase XerD